MEKYPPFEDTRDTTRKKEASLSNVTHIDAAVFNQLYLDHIQLIYRYIYSKLGEKRQSEDLTAQVFLAALEGLPRYRHDGHFTAWLFGIARHKLADHYRSRPKELPIDIANLKANPVDEPFTTLVQSEETERISQLIHQFDEEDQELLRLRIVADLSFDDIARLVHSNMETTKKRFYRLLDQLRKQLELDHE